MTDKEEIAVTAADKDMAGRFIAESDNDFIELASLFARHRLASQADRAGDLPVWPPSEADLNDWLASIVEVFWSASSANYIRAGKLRVEDIKAKYALRDVLERFALGQVPQAQPSQKGEGDE
jgi:hypothetical protein